MLNFRPAFFRLQCYCIKTSPNRALLSKINNFFHFMFDRLNMTLRRLVKSVNLVGLTPITRIGSTIRGSI
jgi:hypothetical protein